MLFGFTLYDRDGFNESAENELLREKTGLWVFRPGLTQTQLYKHRRWLEA